ncbi:MAG: hypothetical protein SXA11_13205 [Cyanobacteriota bacterium]|nr:hypothetical protein [Cyanobacteriota bacterium]
MPQKITSEDLKDVLTILREIAKNQAIIEGSVELLQTGENCDLVIRMLKAYLQSQPEAKLQKITSLLNHLKNLMALDELSDEIDKEFKKKQEEFNLNKDLW